MVLKKQGRGSEQTQAGNQNFFADKTIISGDKNSKISELGVLLIKSMGRGADGVVSTLRDLIGDPATSPDMAKKLRHDVQIALELGRQQAAGQPFNAGELIGKTELAEVRQVLGVIFKVPDQRHEATGIIERPSLGADDPEDRRYEDTQNVRLPSSGLRGLGARLRNILGGPGARE